MDDIKFYKFSQLNKINKFIVDIKVKEVESLKFHLRSLDMKNRRQIIFEWLDRQGVPKNFNLEETIFGYYYNLLQIVLTEIGKRYLAHTNLSNQLLFTH